MKNEFGGSEMEIKELLSQYYAQYNEDGRLLDFRRGQLEFATTMKYIQKYLRPGEKVLEIGAGTGRYSLSLAAQGFDVTAVELLECNLNILNAKVKNTMNIRTILGDALALSMLADATFDITLMLGPMYHLFTETDKRLALSEAARVTKTGGVLMVAYCISDAWIIEYGFRNGNIRDLVDKGFMNTETFAIRSDPKEFFEFIRKSDIDRMNAEFPLERLHYAATDGLGYFKGQDLEEMDQATFDLFMKYHLTICENPDLVGATMHNLDVLRKR